MSDDAIQVPLPHNTPKAMLTAKLARPKKLPPKIQGQEYELVPLDALRPHPRNVNVGASDAIAESIAENGWFGAVVAQRSTGYILAGNHRFAELGKSGAETVPTIWVECDDRRALKILLVDNRTARLGSDDPVSLVALLQELAPKGLEGTGYDGDDLDALIAELSGPVAKEAPEPQLDKAEELRVKWGVERGQIWHVGRHRVMCGDACDAGDVAALLDGAKPNLMVTDPPYGVNYDPAWRDEAAEKGHLAYAASRVGKVTADDRVDWREAWALFPGNVVYTWSPGGDHVILTGLALQGSGFEIRNQIMWRKPHFPISRGAYTYQHEPCWYAVRKGQKANWIGEPTSSTVWDIPLDKNVEGGHSTQKPLECMRRPIGNHAGDVYEPFAGSGTTICAAEIERRACYAMEIEPSYTAVCLQRLADMGLAPKLIENVRTDPVPA